jgi:hypothetical protein
MEVQQVFETANIKTSGDHIAAVRLGAEIALGLWLIASPLIFGYSGDDMLRAWHATLGGIVVLLGALQLWQDWRLSDQELAKHPQ